MLDRLRTRLATLSGRRANDLRVFVSYRREAGPGQAHHLATDLERHLGTGRVFLDERAIGAGEDFDAVINQSIGGCDVLVAVIGPGWMDSQQRLLEPGDYVRREIEAALERHIPVIPVSLPEATMPDAGALPESLRSLRARPHCALEIPSDALWAVGVDSLARWLRAIGEGNQRRRSEISSATSRRERLERDLARARERAGESRRAVASAAERRGALEQEIPAAADIAARRTAEAEPARVGGGLRVFFSHLANTAVEAERLAADLGPRIGADHVLGVGAATGRTSEPDLEPIERADVVITLIGPDWPPPSGDDAERLAGEIGRALERRLAIIPLLTQHAQLPAASRLPEAIRPLLAHHALALPEQFWDTAVERLADRLRQIEEGVVKRERAAADAIERHRDLERELERLRARLIQLEEKAETAASQVESLEQELTGARDTERRLGAEPLDSVSEFLAGPPAPAALRTP